MYNRLPLHFKNSTINQLQKEISMWLAANAFYSDFEFFNCDI